MNSHNACSRTRQSRAADAGVMLLMKNKQDYKLAENIVREAIHKIDPYSLLEGGAPSDEFDSEISSVTNQLQRCNSGKDVANAIARTLTSSFGEKFQSSELENEGNSIYAELQRQKLA
jgi:hypothetical protein